MSNDFAVADFGTKYEMLGFVLELTCPSCPEQYDVYMGGEQVGYLRLRHGCFRADYPNCGGEAVYTAHPEGDGSFTGKVERQRHLTAAIRAIKERHEQPAN